MKRSFIFKTIIATVVLVGGASIASADWYQAPSYSASSNSLPPLNSGPTQNEKLGQLIVGQTADTVGLRVQNGIYVSSAAPDAARVLIDELGDTPGYWSGIEFRKNNFFMGGLFKAGGDEASNDIAIWNKTKPVVTVKQDHSTTFAGQIRIRGGNPAAGKVLSTTGIGGDAVWITPTVTLGGVTLGSINTYTVTSACKPPCGAGAYSPAQIAANSCPAGTSMVGFHLVNVGDNYDANNPIYCR